MSTSKQCFPLPALEYHLAHGCNLSCQQCSHYSNHHLAGALPTVEDAQHEYSLWSHLLRPQRFALLGGEPLLNPQIEQHIELARRCWPDSQLMLVTNGFLLHRFPGLPETLLRNKCQMEVSQHGTAAAYLERFAEVKRLVWQWRVAYPGITINIRRSHKQWMRQYRVEADVPSPFASKPNAAYKICLQRHCTQLADSALWKCPALAHFGKFEAKLQLHSLPQWQLFRDYQACLHTCTDAELRQFLDTASIPQCGLCPSKRIAFVHPDPLQRSPLK